jgi:ATP-binding protein involved in chromosome partitioning
MNFGHTPDDIEKIIKAEALTLLGPEPERLGAFESKDQGRSVLTLYADGWNLNQKSEYEASLKSRLKSQDGLSSIADGLVINFKRRQSVATQSPKPLDALNTAFGLTLKRKAIVGVKKIIAVGSGKGGVGKSTVSVNLAYSLKQLGYKVGLLDADFYGPSVPLMLNVSDVALQVNAQKKIIPLEKNGMKILSFGLLAHGKAPLIWRGPMISKAFEQLCYQADWGELDILIVDLPPGTGDIQLTLVEQIPLTGAVIVTTPQQVATLDADKSCAMFEKLGIKILGIVENMSMHHCSACGHAEPIFGDGGGERLARDYDAPLLGQLPLDPKIRHMGDQGQMILDSEQSQLKDIFMNIGRQVGSLALQ